MADSEPMSKFVARFLGDKAPKEPKDPKQQYAKWKERSQKKAKRG